MIVPALFLLLSVAGIAAALMLPGLSDLMLLAAPSAIACLILLASAYLRRAKTTRTAKQTYIILDGSNIMYWNGGTPQAATLREVVTHLQGRGFTPGAVFDANAGHILFGKYFHHSAMGRAIGLPEDKVMVVQKGTPADPTILAAARDLGARIVTNDRYTNWSATHPEVREPGRLIRGGYRDGQLWLDLEPVNHRAS